MSYIYNHLLLFLLKEVKMLITLLYRVGITLVLNELRCSNLLLDLIYFCVYISDAFYVEFVHVSVILS